MSRISSAMQRANYILANAKDDSLSYRTTVGSGSWVTLSGFVLEPDEIALPAFDEPSMAEEIVRSGRLTGPLTPVLATGYGIRDTNGDEWAVITAELNQQQICTLRRTTVDGAGPNRDGIV